MTTCGYPVRVRTDVPWDDVWPGELPCGLEATHNLELGFYLDGYSRPGLTRPRTNLFTLALCDKHAEFMPMLAVVGPKAAELVEPGRWKRGGAA